jgi:hypothetical protein
MKVFFLLSLFAFSDSQDANCINVCQGGGYCSGSNTLVSCTINCKDDICDCDLWLGDCTCTTNCDVSGVSDLTIGILIIVGIILCCIGTCCMFYWCGRASTRQPKYVLSSLDFKDASVNRGGEGIEA